MAKEDDEHDNAKIEEIGNCMAKYASRKHNDEYEDLDLVREVIKKKLVSFELGEKYPFIIIKSNPEIKIELRKDIMDGFFGMDEDYYIYADKLLDIEDKLKDIKNLIEIYPRI